MRSPFLFIILLFILFSCNKDEELQTLVLLEVQIGDVNIPLDGSVAEEIPIDSPLNLRFSHPLDASAVSQSIALKTDNQSLNFSTNLSSDGQTIIIQVIGGFEYGKTYELDILNSLKSSIGVAFAGQSVSFISLKGSLKLIDFTIVGGDQLAGGIFQNAAVSFETQLVFNYPVDKNSLEQAFKISGKSTPGLTFLFSDKDQNVTIKSTSPLQYLSGYLMTMEESLRGAEGEPFTKLSVEFYTQLDPNPKFPLISDEELLTKVQEQTFRYFWDFAHPVSGMARERNKSGNTVTSGGTGFGLMAILVGVQRNFVTRQQAVDRWVKIVDFLATADRFHGAWPHWLDGESGKVIPFSTKDNGGDLVETALLVQGLLTVKAYLDPLDPGEKSLSDQITELWESVEWDWYTQNDSGVLYWHWSPNYQWEMNLPISGYNEALIAYVLAASSPTHSIAKSTYDKGWAKDGAIKNGNSFYGHVLPLGEHLGGPLFFSQHSFLGLDPRKLKDQNANYWEQNVNHSLINQAHAIANPNGFVGYGTENWGFTASDNQAGYSAHSPTNDLGVISPTAALSAFPYTPDQSMLALKHFYYLLGDKIWGEFGFTDAFNTSADWYADSYLAIDQGPIVIMIENYRSGMLWDLFMKNQEIHAGLDKLQFEY